MINHVKRTTSRHVCKKSPQEHAQPTFCLAKWHIDPFIYWSETHLKISFVGTHRAFSYHCYPPRSYIPLTTFIPLQGAIYWKEYSFSFEVSSRRFTLHEVGAHSLLYESYRAILPEEVDPMPPTSTHPLWWTLITCVLQGRHLHSFDCFVDSFQPRGLDSLLEVVSLWTHLSPSYCATRW